MSRIFIYGFVAAIASLGLASGSWATSIVNIDIPGKTGTSTVECDTGVDCDGLLENGDLDEDDAFAFFFDQGNAQTIEDQFEDIFDDIELVIDVDKFDAGGSNTFTLDDPGWFFVKAGTYRAFIFADDATQVTYRKTGNDPGLSNYGTISTVPLPAGAWLLLGGLGGLAAMKRRRKA